MEVPDAALQESTQPLPGARVRYLDLRFRNRRKSGLPRIIRFLNDWAGELDNFKDILVVRYEDLRSDPEIHVNRLMTFLGEDVSADAINGAVDFASVKKMRKMESENYFWRSGSRVQAKDPSNPHSFKVRKAKVGGYRDYFDDEQIATLDAIVDEAPDTRFRLHQPGRRCRATSNCWRHEQMRMKVFIQTNERQLLGALVSAYSMKRNSAQPDEFDVEIMHVKDFPFLAEKEGQTFLRGGTNRVWRMDDLQSFTPLRFMPPKLMAHEGRAVVVDPDVFAAGDVCELFNRDMEGAAVMGRRRSHKEEKSWQIATSVMLLDCAKLRHWETEKEFDEMFRFERDYKDWIVLGHESPENIGVLEDEWNDFDKLTDNTKMLHNTKRRTQPWKTGLPVDYTPANKFKKHPALAKLNRCAHRSLANTVFSATTRPIPTPGRNSFSSAWFANVLKRACGRRTCSRRNETKPRASRCAPHGGEFADAGCVETQEPHDSIPEHGEAGVDRPDRVSFQEAISPGQPAGPVDGRRFRKPHQQHAGYRHVREDIRIPAFGRAGASQPLCTRICGRYNRYPSHGRNLSPSCAVTGTAISSSN